MFDSDVEDGESSVQHRLKHQMVDLIESEQIGFRLAEEIQKLRRSEHKNKAVRRQLVEEVHALQDEGRELRHRLHAQEQETHRHQKECDLLRSQLTQLEIYSADLVQALTALRKQHTELNFQVSSLSDELSIAHGKVDLYSSELDQSLRDEFRFRQACTELQNKLDLSNEQLSHAQKLMAASADEPNERERALKEENTNLVCIVSAERDRHLCEKSAILEGLACLSEIYHAAKSDKVDKIDTVYKKCELENSVRWDALKKSETQLHYQGKPTGAFKSFAGGLAGNDFHATVATGGQRSSESKSTSVYFSRARNDITRELDRKISDELSKSRQSMAKLGKAWCSSKAQTADLLSTLRLYDTMFAKGESVDE